MAEAKIKIIKKKWLPIRATKFFDNEMLGECYVQGVDQLLGRTVSANLANLTGDIRQQSVTLKFIVRSLEGEAGIADITSYETASSAVRRVVRRGSDRLDDSFLCETSTGQKVRVKPLLITKTLTNSAVHRALRKMMVGSIARFVKGHTFESLISEAITSKLQTTIKAELKKVYPLKSVEILALQLVSQAQETAQAAETVAEPVAAVEQPAAQA